MALTKLLHLAHCKGRHQLYMPASAHNKRPMPMFFWPLGMVALFQLLCLQPSSTSLSLTIYGAMQLACSVHTCLILLSPRSPSMQPTLSFCSFIACLMLRRTARSALCGVFCVSYRMHRAVSVTGRWHVRRCHERALSLRLQKVLKLGRGLLNNVLLQRQCLPFLHHCIL